MSSFHWLSINGDRRWETGESAKLYNGEWEIPGRGVTFMDHGYRQVLSLSHGQENFDDLFCQY